MHAEYDVSFAPSIPSTAPSSPLYIQSMGSRDSYFSTPSYSSLDPNEDYTCDDEDPFPSYDNNIPHGPPIERDRAEKLGNTSTETSSTASLPIRQKPLTAHDEVRDDLDVEHEPSRHVDYLSHEWEQSDIWSSWRYVVARRTKIANWERLENAAWRTWSKTRQNLRTISPESLNWMKDCDVTWLYGPLHVDSKKGFLRDPTPPPSRVSTSSSFLHKKPILKKRSPSAILLEKSLNEHTLLKRAGDIIQVQRSSPVPGRQPRLRRGGSDFSLPSFHTSSVLNTPAEGSDQSDSTTRCSFGAQTPFEPKHVFFNEKVEQVQAIESEEDEKENEPEGQFLDSDEDDDGGLMMAPARIRSNRSTPRSSFSDGNKTIAPLPPTTLKSRSDTPEPQTTPNGNLWAPIPNRSLQHSSSQETLKPSKPNHNFLLDDDPELNDDPWTSQTDASYSPYAVEYQDEPHGMRRTASGMFMPYDENEEEAAMNNTLFGQAVYAVNTFKDIAHVIWNVGWSRNR